MTKQEALAAFGDESNMIVRHRRSGKRYVLNIDCVETSHRNEERPYVYGVLIASSRWRHSSRVVWFFLDSVEPE